jgi:predicted ABC-class ATPase
LPLTTVISHRGGKIKEGEHMRTADDLAAALRRIDGKGYKAYKDIQGDYDLGASLVHIDHVQSDPFAPPSRLRVTVSQERAGVPAELFGSPVRRAAAEDFLTRSFAREIQALDQSGPKGAKAPVIGIDKPGQEILPRTSMLIDEAKVQARFVLGLPARGRTILGRRAEELLLKVVPRLAEKALVGSNLDLAGMKRHVEICEDQDYLRRALVERGLAAFVGNGAVLPRESGVSDRPLSSSVAVPFVSPEDMEVAFQLPNQGTVSGMGLAEGVTLVVGGGYHGKSTLLKALERSVYNHIPGDGRELVVARDSAVKIRAEDGRSVAGVDIEPFIRQLPMGRTTWSFSSDNASGSTSQAANIMEALEAGSSLLLLDEDTSATNFMIRDSRMQRLVARECEPITPFIDRVREMYSRLGVSTILVLGGSGDYLDVADQVIMLTDYRVQNVTQQAAEIAQSIQTSRASEVESAFDRIRERIPKAASFALGPKDKVKTKGLGSVFFGREHIDLSQVEQLVDQSQTRALAAVLRILHSRVQSGMTLGQVVEHLLQEVYTYGLDVLSPSAARPVGDLALPRREEVCAAVNRLRTLQVQTVRTEDANGNSLS